ncbi:MAG: hypothetical protein K2M46_10085 [Lachnospiraceae bacterium]|nr:hypothetical protein [Lachnospiraceae bacterium]
MREIKGQKKSRYLILLGILTVLLGGCHRGDSGEMKAGLFSWSSDVFQEREQQRLFDTMEKLEIQILYQSFSKELSQEQITSFLQQAYACDIQVYLLTGEPAWGLEDGGREMCQEIAYAQTINEAVIQGKIQGIMMDTEPYLCEEWEENPKEIMESYVGNMKQAYQCAREAGFTFVACIPYYFDSWGYDDELADLIQTGCDEVAIMNYSKSEEAEHIRTEAELAAKGEKELIIIYELQAPGKHGLVENNTYYHQGIPGVLKSVESLSESYELKFSKYALHEYQAVREVLERE